MPCRGHSGEEVQTLLAENHFLAVKVPNNCNDRLQPLDLSVNKAVKDRLRYSFTSWYASQVTLQIESGKSIQDVRVDTRLSIMKELEAKWIVSACDYLRSNPSIIVNGFKAAGIVDAVEGDFTLASKHYQHTYVQLRASHGSHMKGCT